MQAVYYGLRVNVLVLREAAQKAVAERRAQEAKAAQASSTAETPAEVKPEQPGQTGNANPPAPTAGAAGKLWQNCFFCQLHMGFCTAFLPLESSERHSQLFGLIQSGTHRQF